MVTYYYLLVIFSIFKMRERKRKREGEERKRGRRMQGREGNVFVGETLLRIALHPHPQTGIAGNNDTALYSGFSEQMILHLW